MKKKLLSLCTAALLLSMAGCAGSPPPAGGSSAPSSEGQSEAPPASVNSKEEEYRVKSLAYLSQFKSGSYDAFYENVTAEFSGQIDKTAFAGQWAMILSMLGKPEGGAEQTTVTEQDGNTIVQITGSYSLRKLVSTFVYDGEDKVAGAFSQFAPIQVAPQSSGAWEEQPIQVGPEGKKLDGLLTLPKGAEKPPVVLLLQGSGPSNMDEGVGAGGNKPFADIAHGLAEKGVATLRYDKRTYTYPADAAGKGVEFEYLDDAKAAVQLVLKDSRVDGGRIYLLGHSEGGMVGPQIAKDNPEIKGFISLAGTLRRLEDLLLEQTKSALSTDTAMTEEQKSTLLAQTEEQVRQVKAIAPADTGNDAVILNAPAYYWASLNAIDGPALVKELHIPMLILQGGEDFQVLAAVDYPLWQDALGGKTDAAFKLYPGLSHLFMPGGSKDIIDTTVYDVPAQVDPQVTADIADWVNGLA